VAGAGPAIDLVAGAKSAVGGAIGLGLLNDEINEDDAADEDDCDFTSVFLVTAPDEDCVDLGK